MTTATSRCCAADGRAVKILTEGAAAQPVPTSDTWVEVLGTVTPANACE